MKLLLNPDGATSAATIADAYEPLKSPEPPRAETTAEKIARLESENAAMRGRITEFDQAEREKAEREKIIEQKMQAGLTREQAIAVIKRQKLVDAALEAEWATRRPKIIELLRRFRCTQGEVPYKCRLEIRKIVGPFIVLPEIQAAQKWLAAQGAEAAAK